MKKRGLSKIAIVIPVVLSAVIFLSACGPEPRLAEVFVYNPGGSFSTNINNPDDPRRQVHCTILFEVIDEHAVVELLEHNFIVRDAVLKILGQLTMDDMIANRDLDALAYRIVNAVNEAIDSAYPLILGAYFTDFSLG